MKHMAILTHGPETCAAAIAEIGDKANSALAQLEVGSEKNGVTIEGFWVDPPDTNSTCWPTLPTPTPLAS